MAPSLIPGQRGPEKGGWGWGKGKKRRQEGKYRVLGSPRQQLRGGSELPARAGAPLTPLLARPPCIAATPATTRTIPTWDRVTSSPGWTRGCRARAWGSAGGSPSPRTSPTGRMGLVGLLPLSPSPERLAHLPPLLCPLITKNGHPPHSCHMDSIPFTRTVPPFLPFHTGEGLLSLGKGDGYGTTETA